MSPLDLGKLSLEWMPMNSPFNHWCFSLAPNSCITAMETTSSSWSQRKPRINSFNSLFSSLVCNFHFHHLVKSTSRWVGWCRSSRASYCEAGVVQPGADPAGVMWFQGPSQRPRGSHRIGRLRSPDFKEFHGETSTSISVGATEVRNDRPEFNGAL